jgi:membrane protein required for colicin V production
MSSIAFIDLVFLVLLGLFIIRGYARGFVTELFSWAALAMGIIAAVFFYHVGAEFLRTKTILTMKYLPEILAFLGIFLIVFLLFKMIEKVLKDIVVGVKLGGLNKFLGLVFGIVEGVAIIGLALFIITIQPLFSPDKVLAGSFFADILLPFMEMPAGPSAVPVVGACGSALTVRAG